MGVEAFEGAEGLDRRNGLAQAVFVESDQARAPLELIDGETGEAFPSPARRQRVAGDPH